MELLDQAQSILWSPEDIQLKNVEDLLGKLMSNQIDFGELFFQSLTSESWTLENGIVKSGSFGLNKGVGIRAVSAGGIQSR